MKKFLLTIVASMMMLFAFLTISASADRHTQLPITMYQTSNYMDTLFTLDDFYIFVSPDDDVKYTNLAHIGLVGKFNQGSQITFIFYSYDSNGNHIDTDEVEVSKWYNLGLDEIHLIANINIPDVAAFIEVGTAYPGSWSHTYFYNEYTNVCAKDGRVLGIPKLLVPAYEAVGWHHTEVLYALDGRTLEVPYYNIEAYQKVGWYLKEDLE